MPMVEPIVEKGMEYLDETSRDDLQMPSFTQRLSSHMRRWNFAHLAGLDPGISPVNDFSKTNFSFSGSTNALLGEADYKSIATKPLRAGIVDYFLICGPATDDDGNLQLASGDSYCNTTPDSGMESFHR